MDLTNVKYVSSAPLIAEIKLQLKNYFESGLLTEAVIPTYIDNGMRKLGNFVLKPDDYVISIKDYNGSLPQDFFKLIVASSYDWVNEYTAGTPSTTGWYVRNDDCVSCTNCPNEGGVFEKIVIDSTSQKITLKNPEIMRVVYSDSYCIEDCENKTSTSGNELKIFGNKVTTTFEEGFVNLRYFKKPVDENGLPLIPEVYEVEEFVKAWTTYLLMEQLFNGSSMETYNQVKDKFTFYRQNAYAKLESVLNVLKMQSASQIKRAIARQRKYNLKHIIR
jgi:hypothetical protein